MLAAVAGALASADIAGWRRWWAVAAAVLGGVASAVTGFETSYQFDRLARNYEKTVAALARAMSRFPGDACTADGDESTAIASAVAEVEGVLLAEVDQWAKQTAVPSAPPPDERAVSPPSAG